MKDGNEKNLASKDTPAAPWQANGGPSPDGVAADNKPRLATITRLGYTISFLFIIAGTFVSRNGADFGRVFLVVIILIPLMLVLWLTDGIVKSRSGHLYWLGVIVSSVILIGMTSVLVATMSYLIFARPPAVGRFFNGQPVVLPPHASVKGTSESAVTLVWEPYTSNDAQIEVSVMERGSSGAFPKPQYYVEPSAGHVVLTGLNAGTPYVAQVVADIYGISSPPVRVDFHTDVHDGPISNNGVAEFYYSGPVGPDGSVNAASVVLKDDPQSRGPTWTYTGEVHDSRPDGKGIFRAPSGCEDLTCTSICEGEFSSGRIKSATCRISFPRGISIEKKGGTWPFHVSAYQGGVGDGVAFLLGPFPAAFSGKGRLEETRTGYVAAGEWKDQHLDGYGALTAEHWEEVGHWQYGDLEAGFRVRLDGSFEISNGQLSGAAFLPNSRGASFGRFTLTAQPNTGYQIYWDYGALQANEYPTGTRPLTPTSSSSDPECLMNETLALYKPGSDLKDGGWSLVCNAKSATDATCELDSSAGAVTFRAKRQAQQMLVVTLQLYRNPTRAAALDVRGFKFIGDRQNGFVSDGMSAAALASMCVAEREGIDHALNEAYGSEVKLKGFCQLSAVMVARLAECVPP